MIQFRNAEVQDIPQIRELAFAIWPQAYAKILTAEQSHYMLEMMYSPESLFRQMDVQQHRFIIACENDSAVGFASWSFTKETHIYKLHKIYVLPDKQGGGIGKKLINQVIADIGSSVSAILELNVNRFNNAKEFYSRLGFKVVREVDIAIGNGFFMNDYVMQKSIGTNV